MEFLKKNYKYLMAILSVFLIFIISYIITESSMRNVKEKNVSETKEINNILATSSKKLNGDSKISEDTILEFKGIDINEKSEQVEKSFEAGKELKGKTLKELEKRYSSDGYKLQFFIGDNGKITKVVFVKERIAKEDYNYEEGKYIIGVYNNRLTVFKVKSNGIKDIENPETDITNIRVDTSIFPTEEKNRIESGGKEFEFDTKEEAFGEKGIKAYYEFSKSE